MHPLIPSNSTEITHIIAIEMPMGLIEEEEPKKEKNKKKMKEWIYS